MLATILAQNSVSLTPSLDGTGNQISTFTIGGILQWAVTAVVIVAGLLFFFMLVFGGIRWVVSGGNKEATEGARSQITAALVGLVIVFSAWAIAQLITSVFGVDILNFDVPGITPGTG